MEYVAPEFPVKSVEETQQYFKNVLGFKIDWNWEGNYGSVSRGKVGLFFYQCTQPRPGHSCYLKVDNAEELYAEWKRRGAKVVEELESRPWGMREFMIEDPNGHHFRVGESVKKLH